MKRSHFLKLAAFSAAATPAVLPGMTLSLNGAGTKKPKRLQPGNTIAITAPAGAIFHPEKLEVAKTTLQSLGLTVKVGASITKRSGYLAGTDEERAQELMGFLTDPEVHGIIAARGGWGCARLLNHLDFTTIPETPKVLCGFSDLTFLLNMFHSQLGWTTFHGPVGINTWSPATINSFKEIVMEAKMPVYHAADATVYTGGRAEGRLIGGNLAVFTTLLGTAWMPNLQDAILFLEETEEEPYAIDRMLTQLQQANVLNQVKAVVFGSCNKCVAEKPEESFTLHEVMQHHFSNFRVPVISGFSFGHTVDKITLPVGINAKLDTKMKTLQLLESAVV
jgi:muramoyltetrapeptide carboxypeptidase